ncbi:MAG: aminoacyl-tRNA hydrolase [Bdellovibrionaceae bacterium]|nr:aminoacyl-tRNA hydrolase [Bdellovibrio sp.]
MKIIIPWTEIDWTSTRSSGAGGQHVNKTNSAVQLRFSISNSQVLNEIEKQKLLTRLAYRLVQGDEILIRNENERDQKSNKESAYKNLNLLIINALKDPKKRVATKPKKSSIRKRLETKKIRGEIKKTRSDKVKW